jgi:hypothetical protein
MPIHAKNGTDAVREGRLPGVIVATSWPIIVNTGHEVITPVVASISVRRPDIAALPITIGIGSVAAKSPIITVIIRLRCRGGDNI